MLDARVTAVYYCLICLFIYLIVRVLSPSGVRRPKTGLYKRVSVTMITLGLRTLTIKYMNRQAAYSQANSTGQPVAAVQQQLVYTGWMLDARVTAVYYCLICLFMNLGFVARRRDCTKGLVSR
jgi:hypothetical protein